MARGHGRPSLVVGELHVQRSIQIAGDGTQGNALVLATGSLEVQNDIISFGKIEADLESTFFSHLNVSGHLDAGQGVGPGTFTVAGLPAASANTGRMVYVSNGAAGLPILAFSDGTNWLRCDTRAAVS